MNRRDTITALLALCAAAPLGARAQQPRSIVLLLAHVGARENFLEAFRAGMREHGWSEGRDFALEVRLTNEERAKTEAVVRAIVSGRPAIIVAVGGAAATPLNRIGTTSPTVFAYSGDPVEGGLVKSFNRPGGNFTGMSWMSLELVGKRLEMLRDILPRLHRAAVFANPFHPGQQKEKAASEAAAAALGIELRYYTVRNPEELGQAMAAARDARCEALDVFPDGLMLRERARIADFAKTEKLASISGWLEFAEAGFLASYGVNRTESIRRLASYASRILRGAAPADLPVELPTIVEAAVNLKTARTLGLTIPALILARTTTVIE